MLIRNKEAWGVKKLGIVDGIETYVINKDYELDILRALPVFLGLDEPLEIFAYSEGKKIVYFYINSTMWELSDNGGEFNIAPVNSVAISVPYTKLDSCIAINPVTMAYRLKEVINFFNESTICKKIDWSLEYNEAQCKVIMGQSKGFTVSKNLNWKF